MCITIVSSLPFIVIHIYTALGNGEYFFWPPQLACFKAEVLYF